MQVSGSLRIQFVKNGVDGTDGKDGKDGKGIESVTEEYALHTSGTTAPSEGWSTTLENPTKEKPYLWNRETTEYTDGTQRTVPAHVVAMYSADGRGIKSITNFYLASDKSSGIDNETEGFTEKVQEITPELPYLWNYEQVLYDDDTSVKTDACIIGVYGANGIIFDFPTLMVFRQTSRTINSPIRAWRNGEQLITSTSQITLPTEVSGGVSGTTMRQNTGDDGKPIIYIEVIRADTGTEVDWTGEYAVTIEGVTYPFTITVGSIADGEKGEKGDKGDTGDTGASGTNGADAVYYHLESTANNATYYPARGVFSPESVTFTMYETKGSTTSPLECYWYVSCKDGSNNTFASWYGNTATSSITVPFDQTDFLASSVTVQACSVYNNTGSQYDGCERTVTVTTSCAVRLQNWEDVATGFKFENGAVGCTYIDVVIYNGSYYQCKTTHTKTTDNYPTSTTATNSNLWTGVNKMDNIATNLLLATTAKVDNLYVDDVYMESTGDETKKTAVWISPAHCGMKVMKMDDDFASGRENTESNDWSNPTTWFHGGSIPDIDDVYSSSTTSPTATLTLSGDSYINTTSGDVSESGITRLGYALLSVSSGSPSTLTIPEMLTASVTDGAYTTGSGGRLAYSEVRFEVRIATSLSNLSSDYTVIRSFSVSNDMGQGGTTTRTMAQITYSFTPTTNSVYVGIYRTSYAIRSGGSYSVPSASNTIKIDAVVSRYVSQFGADGVFIGRNSNSYFRLLMGDSEQRHTLLANGYGLDVTDGAVLQYSNGNRMPVGGTLLLGYFIVGTSSVTGTVWTFDGQAPTITYLSTGCWRIASPSWNATLGTSSSHQYCVTVTPLSATNASPYTARTYNYTTNEWGNFSVDIATYNGSELTNVSCFVRIDFIGTGTNTLSVTSLSADGAQGIAQGDENENENDKQEED